jgi:hypothetical protein
MCKRIPLICLFLVPKDHIVENWNGQRKRTSLALARHNNAFKANDGDKLTWSRPRGRYVVYKILERG